MLRSEFNIRGYLAKLKQPPFPWIFRLELEMVGLFYLPCKLDEQGEGLQLRLWHPGRCRSRSFSKPMWELICARATKSTAMPFLEDKLCFWVWVSNCMPTYLIRCKINCTSYWNQSSFFRAFGDGGNAKELCFSNAYSFLFFITCLSGYWLRDDRLASGAPRPRPRPNNR